MRYWRGDHVIVFPRNRVKFHTCVVCGHKLDFKSKSAETGVGQECARKCAAEVEKGKAEALERDRRRYRSKVVDLGFKIEL